MLILVALLILAALIIYDGWSTQYLLHRGYTEGNPLARWMVSKGTWGQILACVVGFSACAAITFLFAHYGHSLLSGVFAFLSFACFSFAVSVGIARPNLSSSVGTFPSSSWPSFFSRRSSISSKFVSIPLLTSSRCASERQARLGPWQQLEMHPHPPVQSVLVQRFVQRLAQPGDRKTVV